MKRRRAWQSAAFAALCLCAATLSAAPVRHDIRLSLDPARHRLEGSDRIELDAPRSIAILLSPRLHIDSIKLDAKPLAPRIESVHGLQRVALPRGKSLEVRWSGELASLTRKLEHRETLGYNEPVCDPTGSFLPSGSGWYPMIEGEFEHYRLHLDLPADQRGLVPGQISAENVSAGRYQAKFKFDHPAEGIALVAGPYRVQERLTRTGLGRTLRLRTYFHPELGDLAAGYLDSVAAYIDLYERKIGPYPYSEFSVVSSPTPTGFGLPTLTYLGIDVLRLPFIRATSLGHEVLHNWWGNGVYPDYARGNWSEGLTTFMADYAYREQESSEAARAMRLAWLRDFAAMPGADDRPLLAFTSRTHGASQVVGYNKAAMLFVMLRERIGTPAFDQGIRAFWAANKFRLASWDALRAAFEQTSGQDLQGFFEQWLMRTGAPELRLTAARAHKLAAGWRVDVDVEQGEPAYALSVPLSVRTTAGQVLQRLKLDQSKATLSLVADAEPVEVALDPDMLLMRRLTPAETPPILRDVMLAQHPALIVASADPDLRAAAAVLATRLLDKPAAEAAGATARVVVGLHADIDRWLVAAKLPARPRVLADAGGSAQVWAARDVDGRALLLVSAQDAAAVVALTAPLPHYGRQSYLAFDGARAKARGVWPGATQALPLQPR